MKKNYNAPISEVFDMDIADSIIATSGNDDKYIDIEPGHSDAKERSFSSSSEDDEWLHFTPKFN